MSQMKWGMRCHITVATRKKKTNCRYCRNIFLMTVLVEGWGREGEREREEDLNCYSDTCNNII